VAGRLDYTEVGEGWGGGGVGVQRGGTGEGSGRELLKSSPSERGKKKRGKGNQMNRRKNITTPIGEARRWGRAAETGFLRNEGKRHTAIKW